MPCRVLKPQAQPQATQASSSTDNAKVQESKTLTVVARPRASALTRSPPPFSITFHFSGPPGFILQTSKLHRAQLIALRSGHRPPSARSVHTAQSGSARRRDRGASPHPGPRGARRSAPVAGRAGPRRHETRAGTATGADARHAAAPVDSITVRRAGATQSNRPSLQLTQLTPRSSAVNAIRHMLHTHAHAHRAGVQDVHSTEESLGTYSHPGRFGSVRRCGGSAQARACAPHDIFMVMSH
jgi:hypothetical protein